MTEQQRKAIEILNRLHSPMVLSEEKAIEDDDYFLLLEFIVENKTEIQYVPQPTTPWTTPEIKPYYTGTGEPVIQPPYKVTCEFKKD